MEAIKNTVGAVMQALKAGKGSCPEAKSEAALKKVLTKKELKHIKLHYFKKGILGIKVESSAWLYKLSLEKEKLLNSLRNELAGVKDIRFSIGEIEQDGERQRKK
jgi:hypothetical protein